jgi:hypothetical protein
MEFEVVLDKMADAFSSWEKCPSKKGFREVGTEIMEHLRMKLFDSGSVIILSPAKVCFQNGKVHGMGPNKMTGYIENGSDLVYAVDTPSTLDKNDV